MTAQRATPGTTRPGATDRTGWHLLDPAELLQRIADDLTPEFAGVFGPETVHAYVTDAYERIAAEARIKNYLPALTAKIAHAALVQFASQEKDILMTTVPEVLFVCVHNAGRSQMAAGFLRHHGGDSVVVRSAGSAPAETINPAAVEAMAEVGIDITAEVPTKLLTEDVAASDVVITMGCGDACPIFPGKRYEDWALVDPAGKGIEAVRPIRDEIEARVKALLAEITPA